MKVGDEVLFRNRDRKKALRKGRIVLINEKTGYVHIRPNKEEPNLQEILARLPDEVILVERKR